MKIAVLTIEERINMVEDWLLNSGIQSDDGGFYAWQDMEDKSHTYLYSEITGYAITTLCFLYVVTKNKAFIDRAKRAADWILSDALDPSGGVLTRKYLKNAVSHYSFERGNIYSFDCAMAAFGMCKLYKITKDEEYLKCAEKIAEFLNKKMIKDAGLYYPVFDTKKNCVYEDNKKWSTQSGSFHCKHALYLCELAEIKNDRTYSDMARRLIDVSLSNFCKEGRFVTNISDDTSHLHPYSYTLEGILFYGRKAKCNDYDDVMKQALNWVIKLQDSNGGFPTKVFQDQSTYIVHQRSDIQAQVLRLSYFIKSDIAGERLADRLLEFQNTSFEHKGGFLFGHDEDSSFKKHSNAWCSMFALQALYLATGKVNKDIVLDYLV